MQQVARSAVFIGFEQLCRKHKINPFAILKSIDLEPVVLQRHDLYIPYAKFGQCLNLAAQMSQVPTFALQLSQHHNFLILGPLGLLLSQSESCLEVLKIAQKYVHLHAQGIHIKAHIEKDTAQIIYQIQLDKLSDTRQLIELGFGVIQKTLVALFAERWRPLKIKFKHQALDSADNYATFFNAPIEFGAPENLIELGAELLHEKPLEQKGVLKDYFISQYNHPSAMEQRSLVDDIQDVLSSILMSGDTRISTSARLLDIHPRKLQRELKLCSTSYRKELEKVRFKIAQEQLRYSSISIVDLALNLGYADETAFSRAFKRWSGLAPAPWRRQRN